AMVTFAAPLDLDKLEAAQGAIDRLGNPANAAVRAALALPAGKEEGTHFASLHAIRSFDGTRAYIVFEFSADGSDEEATARIVAGQDRDGSALQRLAEVRDAIAKDKQLEKALEPATAAPPFKEDDLLGLVVAGIKAFVSTYLWPFAALVLLSALLAGLGAAAG